MTRFLLIRHATNDTVGNSIAGRTEGVHLNKEGNEQSIALAERLSGLTIDAIYCSPLVRTQETVAPLARLLHLQPVINDDFNEVDFGEWSGKSYEELDKTDTFKRFNSFRSSTRVPGGEMILEAQMRIITAMDKMYHDFPDKTIAICSHGDVIKSALSFYLGISIDNFLRLEISPASVSIVELYHDLAIIKLVNHTGKIEC